MQKELPLRQIRKSVKRLSIRVKPGGEVIITAPLRMPQSEIDAFVLAKTGWIKLQVDRLSQQQQPLSAAEANQLKESFAFRVAPLFEYWVQRMEVGAAPHLRYRAMSSRWGSCNPHTRKITLSLELARKDDELLEYVIVHELAHLFSAGHGPDFYAVMDKFLPNWKQLRRRLNHPS